MFHSLARSVNSSPSVVPDTTNDLRRRHDAAPEEVEGDANRGATQVVDVLENGESAEALGVPGEVLGEVTKYLDPSTLLSLRMVSRSFDEAPHVRAEFVHRTACALMRKEGLEGLRKALVLIASLPNSLRIGPLQALARDIGALYQRDLSCAVDTLVAAATDLAAFDKRALLMTLSENVYLIWDSKKCASAWNACWDGIFAVNAVDTRGHEQSLVCLAAACNAGVETDVWLERVERILQEVLKVDDGTCRAAAIAELAVTFDTWERAIHQRLMPVYRKVLSAIFELDPQHPQTAVALGRVGLATGILPRADMPAVFKMAVFQTLRLPPAARAPGLLSVLELSEYVPDAVLAEAFGDILSAALELARTSDELWHVLHRAQDLFERLPDEDFRAAFNAVSALVAACRGAPLTSSVVAKLLYEFSRLPDAEVPAALAPLLPSIVRNYRQYHFDSLVEILRRLSPEDQRAVYFILWKEGFFDPTVQERSTSHPQRASFS